MKLSIVTTLYYSAPFIEEFYQRISQATKKITHDYEIIFVNDGSPDKSLEIAIQLHRKDKRVKIIELSRNFGHHKAIMTGLFHAKGDFVFLIDNDLEEKPEFLLKFWRELRKSTDIDVIFGVQEKRSGDYFKKYADFFFYKIFNFFSDYKLPENLITARIMTRRYVDALIAYNEAHTVFAALCQLVGFNQRSIVVHRKYKRSSTYTFAKKFALLIDSISSFSEKPLVFIAYLGFFLLIVSIVLTFYLLFNRVVYGLVLEGWMSLFVSIWLLGGLIIFCIGIVGIYLSKVFIQVKNRPYTIIKKVYQGK